MKLRELVCFCVLLIAFLWAEGFAQTSTSSCAAKSNTTCEECLSNVSCLWCNTDQKCVDYPVQTVLPPASVCRLAEARWGKCWVNFQTLIITLSVLAMLILIALVVCCLCCCKCENIGSSRKADEREERQADLRRFRKEERREQMKTRHDEIRKKYEVEIRIIAKCRHHVVLIRTKEAKAKRCGYARDRGCPSLSQV